MRLLMRLCAGLSLLIVAGVAPAAHAQTVPTAPKGFRVSVFAQGLNEPTALAVGPDHRVYFAEQGGFIGVVGRHGVMTVATGFSTPLGLAWHAHRLYVSSTGRVTTLTPSNHFRSFRRRTIVRGLPAGEHQNDGLAFRGKWMYVGVGSTCNACREPDPRSATIMRFHDDGSHAQIYAHGVRNPFGLAIRPATGGLYATDNGRDDHDDSVPDELNLILKGGRYGWPSCWGNHLGTGCKGTISPVALFEPHASADGIVFYRAHAFSNSYRGTAFVAEWGDDANNLGTGHIVKLVRFSGKRTRVSTFARGFQHPLAVTVSPNGSLLVADWGTGIIWRIRRG